ncbi:TolC family protein [Planktothricoides sp. SR001]|uniref:TolC family protein n=1 Tax=Planktothricoides sp. SR001 TaxID=1705388 RepID=UPI0012E1EBD0|nr:TolC family protein [Planktothricoides sp. SR001]
MNSKYHKKLGKSLFSPDEVNFAIAAICSTTLGLFLSLALVIKSAPKEPASANKLPSQTAPLTLDDIDNIIHHNLNANSSKSHRLSTNNLSSQTGIKKQEAIVDEIPSTDSGSNEGLEEIPPTPRKKGGIELSSAAPSEGIPPTPRSKGGIELSSAAPSEGIPPTPRSKGGIELSSAAPSVTPINGNQPLFPILKTAVRFTGKHWLEEITTVRQIKQENKPHESAKTAEQIAPSTRNDRILELTSQDAIILSLQNNRDIKNAYLQRIIERQDLAIAEAKFTPNFTPSVEVVYNRNQIGAIATNQGEFNLGANLVVKIPTGAEISATWAGVRQAQNTLDSSTIVDQNSLVQNISLNFTQPLLRNFGTDINRASIEIARLNEQANILNLKNTLINNITITLRAYRSLLQAQEALKIQEIALASTQRQLESIDALIEAGRRARIDRTQAETNLANRQLDLLAASNQLEAAKLDLISILDIDKTIQVVAIEQPAINHRELTSWDRESALSISLANNIDYLQSLIDIEIAKIDLLLAENNQKWDLSLQANYLNNLSNNTENNNDLRAGISLSRTFGDRSLDSEVDRSKIKLEIVQNTLEEQREELEISVINVLRDVEFNLQQLEQAKKTRELSEQQLKNEQDKLKLGVGNTRLIDVLDFEQDLVNAKNQELNATIAYLNALTDLYATLGITLDQWDITIEPEN